MPSAAASRATRLPILPSPITPSTEPLTRRVVPAARSSHTPRLHRAVEADHAAQPGQRARQREVGDLAAAVVGRAVARHAGGAQVVEIEVVVARRARDHRARLRKAGEQRRVDGQAAARDQHAHLGDVAVLGRQRARPRPPAARPVARVSKYSSTATWLMRES